MGVGFIAVLFCNEGLIFFIFAFPTVLWVGVLPLLVGFACIFKAVPGSETISVEQNRESVILRRKKWRTVMRNYPRTEIKYISLQYHEPKTRRWLLVFTLFIYLIEVLFRNGMDLLGAAPVAPFLLLNVLLTAIGVVILIAFPRLFLEIGTDKDIVSIPWPSYGTSDAKKSTLLRYLGIDPASLQRPRPYNHLREALREDFSTFLFAVVLLFVGIILMLTPSIFYGQFTAPLAFTLGMKYLFQILNGGKLHVRETESAFLGQSRELTFFHGSIGSLERREVVSLANCHFVELLAYVYLISQSLKYGFRFIWWPFMGFGPVQFALGLILISLIFCKLFIPAHQIRCQLSCFTLILRTILSIPQESIAVQNAPIITKARDFLNSFRAHKGEKTFLWVVVFFVITIVAPAIYYAFGGNSLFL